MLSIPLSFRSRVLPTNFNVFFFNYANHTTPHCASFRPSNHKNYYIQMMKWNWTDGLAVGTNHGSPIFIFITDMKHAKFSCCGCSQTQAVDILCKSRNIHLQFRLPAKQEMLFNKQKAINHELAEDERSWNIRCETSKREGEKERVLTSRLSINLYNSNDV